MAKDRNREFEYYRLTPAGRKQLAREESKWKQLAGAIAQVMWPAEEIVPAPVSSFAQVAILVATTTPRGRS